MDIHVTRMPFVKIRTGVLLAHVKMDSMGMVRIALVCIQGI